ncbi:MAG: SGNH/GDSL hydrolase family protein [Bacteroidetes bacterium]|nr:SGNH/GDSL hydrolase family protein [Bacteroidota bacterium]
MRQFGIGIALVFLFGLTACKEDPIVPTNDSLRVLFVGNSYTYYNQGVDYVLKEMMLADNPAGTFITDRLAEGGYTLEDHAATVALGNKLNQEAWDVVVLQEQSTRPITNPNVFYAGARTIDSMINLVDAETCFYMTWARADDPSMTAPLETAYTTIATELSSKLAPVGKAWEYTLATYPTIVLHQSDKSHPTNAGTYLTACIFYIVLYGENPVGNTFPYTGLSDEDRQNVQQAAWEFMLAY